MPYDAIETSRQAGAPLELYRFVVGKSAVPFVVEPIDGTTFDRPAAPAPPGEMVVPWYTKADDLGLSILHATDGPACIVGISHYENTIPGNVAVCCAAFSGGIGESGGYFFRTFKYTAAHGLLPNHEYVVRALLGFRTSTAFAHGIRFGAEFSAGTIEDAVDYVDFSVTSSGSSEIISDFGHYDLEVLYANIVYLGGLAIFDPELPAGEPTEGGIPGQVLLNYTSADVPVVYQGETYIPAVLIRGPFRYSDEETRTMDVVIEVPRDHPIVTIAAQRAPAPPAACRVYRLHRGDLTDAVTPIMSQVTRCEKVGAKARLTLTPVTSLFEKSLPLEVIQQKCTNQLYGPICKASRTGHEFPGLEVTAVDGRNVTIDGLGALAGAFPTRFTEGVLTGPDGSESTIESYDAAGETPDLVRLYAVNPAVVVGSLVTLLDGCLKDVATCDGLFANLPNHRGEPVMPSRNPGTGAGLN